MLNNIIKGLFALTGSVTGYTLVKTFFSMTDIVILHNSVRIAIFVAVALVIGYLFYLLASKVIDNLQQISDKLESIIHSISLNELIISAAGLVAGLVIANLVTLPLNKLDIIGVPLSIMVNILFASLGVLIIRLKKNDNLFNRLFSPKSGEGQSGMPHSKLKLLDTSAIIDGRILDICRTGFLEGELVVPGFVLEELRHIADSSDSMKRNRGKRGLDVLNMLQKELKQPLKLENIDGGSAGEVDDKLLAVAKKLGAMVLTNDYNLNKVAGIQGVEVLNINELANALKPIALPGEDMKVQVIKDGKESGQGVGYLDDGTMIVMEGGKKYMGETIQVTVTSVLQTAAGRMVFAKPKL